MQKNKFIHPDVKVVCNSAAKKLIELTSTPDFGMTVFSEPNAENRAKYGEMLTLPPKFDFKQIA